VYSDQWAVKVQVLLDIIALEGTIKGSLCTFTVQLVKAYISAYCLLKHLKIINTGNADSHLAVQEIPALM
jgi:hypothetical protein